MDLVLNYKSETPIYKQIYTQISAQILQGKLEADFCLPSIREVARELRISIITVKTAWQKLEQDGLIYTIAGKGCFVRGLSETALTRKRAAAAREKLTQQVAYFKQIGFTEQELNALISRLYKDS